LYLKNPVFQYLRHYSHKHQLMFNVVRMAHVGKATTHDPAY